MGTVVSMKTAAAPAARPRKKTAEQKRSQFKTAASAAVGGVAVALTALSLTHLAHGVELMTGASPWQCWLTAAGVDLGFVALEAISLAVASDKRASQQVDRWARPFIIVLVLLSAVLNALAFSSGSPTVVMACGATVLGAVIPGMIYALTRSSAAVWMSR